MGVKICIKVILMFLLAGMPTITIQAQDWKSILSGVANSIGEKVSEKVSDKIDTISVTGTWKYMKSDCKLQSDDPLSKVGGELAAKKVESHMEELLAKLGIDENTVFSFNSDSTYTIKIGKRTLKGTYSLNKDTKEMTMVSRLKVRSTAKVTKNVLAPTKMGLLFKADKLIALVQNVTNTLAQKSSNKTINAAKTLITKYDGMMLGIELNKQN